MKKDIKYLSEDRDLIDLLCKSGPLTSDQIFNNKLSNIQVQSILRTRKTMVDLDQSNKQYSRVIGLFAIIQIVIAGFSLVLDIKNSPDKSFTVFIGISFITIFLLLIREGNKIMKD